MNDQEKAQHIGEILLALEAGGTVTYGFGRGAPTNEMTNKEDKFSSISLRQLTQHPERFEIKKEPRVIYVNVQRDGDTVAGTTSFDSPKEASVDAIASGVEYWVIAHPIPIPGD